MRVTSFLCVLGTVLNATPRYTFASDHLCATTAGQELHHSNEMWQRYAAHMHITT